MDKTNAQVALEIAVTTYSGGTRINDACDDALLKRADKYFKWLESKEPKPAKTPHQRSLEPRTYSPGGGQVEERVISDGPQDVVRMDTG